MKLVLLLLAFFIFASTDASFTEEEEAKWINFKINFGKLFLSPNREKKRKTAFLENIKELENHNKAFERGETTYVKIINKWADLTLDEFKSRFMGTIPDTEAHPSEKITLRGTAPASVDLRVQGGLGPVRDQNPCGSCWAFGAVGATEHAYWRATGKLIDLSEQHLVNCDKQSMGCEGGYTTKAMDFINTNNGVLQETDYPYVNADKAGTCNIPTNVRMLVALQNPSYKTIDNDEETIKNTLSTYGALVACVDADEWRWDMKGIFTSAKTSFTCNHTVMLVGYGTDPNGIPYWLIRNSWGTQWVEEGYIRVDARRGADGRVNGGLFLDMLYLPQVKVL